MSSLPFHLCQPGGGASCGACCGLYNFKDHSDRKSTRLNSSHMSISYAVFCLKKKKKNSTSYTLLTNRQSTFFFQRPATRLTSYATAIQHSASLRVLKSWVPVGSLHCRLPP